MPDLSVIMPVYNGEAYLCQAIDSILKQTFRNFEFIIIEMHLPMDRKRLYMRMKILG